MLFWLLLTFLKYLVCLPTSSLERVCFLLVVEVMGRQSVGVTRTGTILLNMYTGVETILSFRGTETFSLTGRKVYWREGGFAEEMLLR